MIKEGKKQEANYGTTVMAILRKNKRCIHAALDRNNELCSLGLTHKWLIIKTSVNHGLEA